MAQKSTPDGRFRVKVYELTDDGEWNDKGTGHVQFQVVQSVDAAFLFVHSELDSALIIEFKLVLDDVYERQGDTIITWVDPVTKQNMALSFAEAAGCQYIWERICVMRGVDPTVVIPEVEYTVQISLPEIDVTSLDKTLRFFSELPNSTREDTANTIIREKYLDKLFTHFHTAEEANDAEQLRLFFLIGRAIVMLNESSLLEALMSEKYYLDLFGMFEYDPQPASSDPPKYRHFLKSVVHFNDVIHIEDTLLVTRIHTNFRLQYLRDVVLQRYLDDATFSTLNNLVFFNGVEIAQQLQYDEKFLASMLLRFHQTVGDRTPENLNIQRSVIGMLQEFATLGRSLQPEPRSSFFQTLISRGVLSVFTEAFKHPNSKCKFAALDVLTSCVYHSPGFVRSFILEQKPEFPFLRELINCIIEEPDQGVKGSAAEVLRCLLDPETLSNDQTQERNLFFNVFYERFLDQLLSILSVSDAHETGDLNVTRNTVCHLLMFFVRGHGYRLKYYLLKSNTIEKVCQLMEQEERYIALSAVRFVRTCISMKDDFYFKYMIKNDSFATIVKLLRKHASKNNLLSSAIIELLDFIRKENIQSLIAYITETYKPDLAALPNIDTLNSLWLQYEKNKATYSKPNLDYDVTQPVEDDLGTAKRPTLARPLSG
eukprot:c9440_g1_i1.p1 GENE.c9440_g1_i1~~c9440_g1_i1.p1  ORF type:complete len:655 (-),score=148.03 c9440_g1_i1:93-2057(-)